MIRALLSLAIVALQFVVLQQACGLPPDEVAHSPIPTLKLTVQQKASRTAPADLGPTGRTQQRELLSNPTPNASQRRNNVAKSRVGENAQEGGTAYAGSTSYNPEQQDLWNSPEMREVREFVQEFARRSAQTSPAEGEQFLERLSQLSPEEMQQWLKQFRTRNEQIARGRALDEFRRQWSLEKAISRFEATRRAAKNNEKLLSEAAAPGSMILKPKPGWSWQLESNGPIYSAPSYNPWDPVFDPSSPRGYARRAAAAISLPGDLPPSDPRNFIRGEEGVNFGEGANGSDAPPPTAPAAETPAASGSEAATE